MKGRARQARSPLLDDSRVWDTMPSTWSLIAVRSIISTSRPTTGRIPDAGVDARKGGTLGPQESWPRILRQLCKGEKRVSLEQDTRRPDRHPLPERIRIHLRAELLHGEHR